MMMTAGFIGLGMMGTPIAVELAQKGVSLSVYARSPEKAKPAIDASSNLADSPADVAGGADIVILCVTNTEAVEAVVFGDNGIASTARPGSILIDHSTIDIDSTRAFAARLKDQCDMDWVDAPVSGGPPSVPAGSLVVMAGGDADVFERALPIMGLYSGRVTRMGDVGAGQTTKMINQAMVGINISAMAEIANLAMKSGLEAEKLPEALAGGRADSRIFQEYFPRIVARDFTPMGTVDILLKDLVMVGGLARKHKVPGPHTAAAEQLHRMASARGMGAADIGALIKVYDPDIKD